MFERSTTFNFAAWDLDEMAKSEKYVSFMDRTPGDLYHFKFVVHARTSLVAFTQRVYERLMANRSVHAGQFTTNSFPRFSTLASVNLFCMISEKGAASDAWTETDRVLEVLYCGRRPQVEAVREQEVSLSDAHSPPQVQWHFAQKDRIRTAPLAIAAPEPVYDEFYPFLPRGVNDYIDSYVESGCDVLILLGDAGTGKTSLIRHMIWRHRMHTHFTFDQELLQSDGFFVNFISDPSAQLMVIEDADLMLTSREREANVLMAKFLNLGDGLMKGNSRKKIVFVANALDASRIDVALLRPGRCFDCVRFRPLSAEEARAAARVANRELASGEESYTLAELFADRQSIARDTRAVGFVGRG